MFKDPRDFALTLCRCLQVQQLGFKAIPFLNTSLSLVLSLLRMSYEDLHNSDHHNHHHHNHHHNHNDDDDDDEDDTKSTHQGTLGLSEAKKLRSTCFRIFLLVFTTFSRVQLPTATVLRPLKAILTASCKCGRGAFVVLLCCVVAKY